MRIIPAAVLVATLGVGVYGGVQHFSGDSGSNPHEAVAVTSTTAAADTLPVVVTVPTAQASVPARAVTRAVVVARPAASSPATSSSPSTTVAPVTTTTSTPPSTSPPIPAGTCELTFDKTSVAVGETITATVTSGMPNHRLYFGWSVTSNADGRAGHNAVTDADGVYRESTVVQQGDKGGAGAVFDMNTSHPVSCRARFTIT